MAQIVTFQSLFCWMLFQKMVLPASSPLTSLSFNPYSVGCYFRRILTIFKHKYVLKVSILILLDVISEGVRNVEEIESSIKFQSLFCWMLFQKRFGHPDSEGNIQFQSLFCWMLFQKSFAAASRNALSAFQSLFCWMLFQKPFLKWTASQPSPVSILILLDVISEVY